MSYETSYSHVCRTCLTDNCSMKSLFETEDLMEHSASVGDILITCASIQIFKGDGLPEQVCMQCIQEMNRAFLFRKLCEKSDATLRSCVRTLIPLQVSNELQLNSYVHPNEIEQENENFAIIQCKDEGFGSKEDDIDNDDHEYNPDNAYHDDSCSEEESESEEEFNKKTKVRKKEPKRRMYSCKVCEEVCLGLGQYRKHMTDYHGQIYKCNECNKEFKSESVLSRHLTVHNVSTVPNNENEETKTKTKPRKNKTGIIKKRNLPRTCNICNKTFRFHSNLERHKLIHTGEKPYLCNVCGKGFAQLSYLKIHSFIHTGEKPYQCKMCEKSFAAPGTLMTHIRTHTGERPHICKICGKDFPQSGYLSAHIRTHTGEKPVECKVCHRRFNQSGRLIIHMRIHSGEKPYTCKDCGRSFAVNGTLKKHIRTHTGERPYICNVCGQAFAQSGTLATHMKVHRPK